MTDKHMTIETILDPERAILEDIAENIETYLRDKPCGWVDINLNWAKMTITKRPNYCDRGRYLVQAFHNAEHLDKCWIDEADAFPRYYFNFDCMIRELNSFIIFRDLEVNEILMRVEE